MNILITGGAGYIGSMTVHYLTSLGHKCFIVDDYSAGHPYSIYPQEARREDITKDQFLEYIPNVQIDGVIHFAAKALVAESMEKPDEYFNTNLLGTLNVLKWMEKNNVKDIVFSSSCSIYGNPGVLPVTESTPPNPQSPYAMSKLMCEQMIEMYSKVKGFRYMNLRYFNAAGAHESGNFGEYHYYESHLIPNVIMSILTGKTFNLYGTKYNTPDGTCIRDYVHVEDLAYAHLLALQRLKGYMSGKGLTVNIGIGHGYSNWDVIQAIQRVSGKVVHVHTLNERPGDPAKIYADNGLAMTELGWLPKYKEIDAIVASAWKWHSQHPDGYDEI